MNKTVESSSKSESIHTVLESAGGKNLLICLKGYPDPDNIACALALDWLAKSYKLNTKIIYFDDISHHENRALVKKLDIDMEQVSPDFDASNYQYFAINDSQSTELPIKIPEHCELLVFVDHHKPLGSVKAHHLDVRENVGSTSSIYTEYLQGSEFKGDLADETKIATALMHGIRADTDDYVNATSLDYSASQFLSTFVDKDLLALISRQAISAKTMDMTQIALQHKDIKETFLFSGVGYVREEDRDGIGQCADYLLHREGIETVVVYGIVGTFVDGSLRTKSHTLDPDKWLKDVFGKKEDGTWYGGGRKDKGGFQIPLGVFARCKDRELLWILIKKTIDELFYEKIGIGAQGALDNELGAGKV
ncbi:MAG: DHH family phosphoesterase [Deltaproteobacteria bacterium]|nr:DHH family phosphoesterase [Deltaproteobacteria bacterium]